MTTTNDALRAARDVIAAIREDDFESFTVGRDPETMEPNEAAIIARYDAALSQIDAALAGEAAAGDVRERVARALYGSGVCTMITQIPDAIVEAAARALYAVEWEAVSGNLRDGHFGYESEDVREYWRKSARAALTVTVPLMAGWQKIETAPRDGTKILVKWNYDSWGEQVTSVQWWSGCWFNPIISPHAPSHWSPILPPSPAEDGE